MQLAFLYLSISFYIAGKILCNITHICRKQQETKQQLVRVELDTNDV